MTELFDKPLTDMSTDEIIEYLKVIRTRRAAASERKKAGVAASPEDRAARAKRGEPTKVTGALGDALDDIFGEDEETPKKALDSALDDLTT